MMGCPEVDEKLFDFLYGLLERAEREELEAHVRGCATCEATLARAEAQRAVLRESGRVQLPGGLTSNVLQEAPSRRDRRPLLWAAAVIAAAVGMIVFLRPGRDWAEGTGSVGLAGSERTLRGREALERGEALCTGPGQTAVLTLRDGSRISLAGETRVHVVSEKGRGFRFERGDVRCEVVPGRERFVASTPLGQVAVLGTEFRLRFWGGAEMSGKHAAIGAGAILTVAVAAGTVLVSNDRGAIEIKQDEMAAVRAGELPGRIREADLKRLEAEVDEAEREARELEERAAELRQLGQALVRQYQELKQTPRPAADPGEAGFTEMMKRSMKVTLRRQVKTIVDQIDARLRFTPDQRKDVEAAVLAELERMVEGMLEGKADFVDRIDEMPGLRGAIERHLRPDQQELYRRHLDEEREATRRSQAAQQQKLFEAAAAALRLADGQRTALAPVLGSALADLSRQTNNLFLRTMMGHLSMEEWTARRTALIEAVLQKAKEHLSAEQTNALRTHAEQLSRPGVASDPQEEKKP